MITKRVVIAMMKKQNNNKVNPILARLPELHRWPGKGRFTLLIVNHHEFAHTSANRFEKLIIFLAKIQCFRFSREHLPFLGQDRFNNDDLTGLWQ